MGKMQRDKGARWEREVAKRIGAVLPDVDCRRTGYAQSQDADYLPDVDTGGLFWLECKAGKLPSPRAALAQAQEAAPDHSYPVAIVKDDRRKPFVVMDFEDWLQLVDEWHTRGSR